MSELGLSSASGPALFANCVCAGHQDQAIGVARASYAMDHEQSKRETVSAVFQYENLAWGQAACGLRLSLPPLAEQARGA